MESSFQYQNFTIKYFSEGQGEILLFLHGWPNNSRLWDAQFAHLKDRYKVVAIDWLGFGKSDKPTGFLYTFTEMKNILALLISEISTENESINIVAHDIAGPPAILWSSENAPKVKRLIILNTIIYPFSTMQDKLSHSMMSLPVIGNLAATRFGLKMVMSVMTRSRSTHTKNMKNVILDHGGSRPLQVILKTILDPMNEGRKHEILGLANKFTQFEGKKYIVIAKQDGLCYKHVNKLHEENPEVPIFTVDQCGHLIPIDRPEKLNEILDEIMAQV